MWPSLSRDRSASLSTGVWSTSTGAAETNPLMVQSCGVLLRHKTSHAWPVNLYSARTYYHDQASAVKSCVALVQHMHHTPRQGHICFTGLPLRDFRNRGKRHSHCVVGAGRLGLKDADEVARTRGGMCLSTSYLNNREHLRWRCGKGHVWLASLNNVKDGGSWCPECALESQRLSLQDAQRVASSRGGRCLSTKYVRCIENLEWDCSRGHQWNASLNAVKNQGSWCPQCAVEAQRLSLQVAQDVAVAFGGVCLSTKYVNNKRHLKWKCSNGHVWCTSLNMVKNQGRWCPKCAAEARRLVSLKVAARAALDQRGECLSTKYVNNRRPLKWRCINGHEWHASLNNVKDGGTWCPACALQAQRLSLKDADEVAKSRGGRCLSKRYVNCLERLKWLCRKGHKWSASLNSVKNQGSWCPHCMGNAPLSLKVAEHVARSRQGECLSTTYVNSVEHLTWRCSNGHIWLASLTNVKGGSWCPECATGKSEREVREILEQSIFPGSSFRKCRPKFLRTERGGRLELDGYCKERGIAFEYQGEQHYNPASWFHKGRRRFKA